MRRTAPPKLRPAAALAAVLAAAGCASPGPRTAAPVAAVNGALGDRLSAAIDPVDEVASDGFVPLTAVADLGAVAPALEAWWRRFFRAEALPIRGGWMRLSARAAAGGMPDLVRVDYEMAVLRIDVVDSTAWTLVRVAEPGMDVADGAAAEVIARQILASGPDRRWALALPPRLAESTWYTSNSDVDPGTMASWRERIDVRLRAGRLEFLCHKRGEAERAADSTGWFPPELRARLGTAPR